MQLLEHHEEGRNDKEQGNGTDSHTTDDAEGKGTVTIGTGTTLDDERYHTDNHRGHGHQNWAQTLLAGGKGCIANAHALGTALGGELRNQDGRLRKQTDQHDDTRLQVDVVVHARQVEQRAEVGADKGTHQSERYGEQHG